MENILTPVLDNQKGVTVEQTLSDFLHEGDFDDVASIASQICNTSDAFVALTDVHGRVIRATESMKIAIGETCCLCNYAMHTGDDIFVVPDLTTDPRFQGEEYITHRYGMGFCAAVVLTAQDNSVGILCVLDTQPRHLNEKQVMALRAQGRLLLAQLECRKRNAQFNHNRAELERAYTDLEKVSFIASHDLRGPLNNIISLTHLLIQEYGSSLDEEGNQYISFLNDSAYQFLDMVSGILNYSKSSQLLVDTREKINFTYLIEEVVSLLHIPPNTTIRYDTEDRQIYSSHNALKQILLNLVHNAIRHNDKVHVEVEICLNETPVSYLIEVKDNGPGIHEHNRKKVFELFERLDHNKDGEGTGVGLAIVKRLVEKLDGTIRIDSEVGVGSTFVFFIPKS
jgi:signal transduction histidine kinase